MKKEGEMGRLGDGENGTPKIEELKR